jgi:hypothetical protein
VAFRNQPTATDGVAIPPKNKMSIKKGTSASGSSKNSLKILELKNEIYDIPSNFPSTASTQIQVQATRGNPLFHRFPHWSITWTLYDDVIGNLTVRK